MSAIMAPSAHLPCKLIKSNVNKSLSFCIQSMATGLADKLLDTLRYLVLETNLKINAPGAVMFTTADLLVF
jgi:hypothetical protein